MESNHTVSMVYQSKPSWRSVRVERLENTDYVSQLCEEQHLLQKGYPNYQVTGRLSAVAAQIPAPRRSYSSQGTTERRSQLLHVIEQNQVSVIHGALIGKSLQVPEFLLENSVETGSPVRILSVCAEKISAVASASRIAELRGEKIGDIVGYQIPLESKVSPTTVLTFCSPTVLLRTLTSEKFTHNITHLILNEVHRKEAVFELIFAAVRTHLNVHPVLKLVCISNWDDSDWLRCYFGGLSFGVMCVELEHFHVKTIYLEELEEMGLQRSDRDQYTNRERWGESVEPWHHVAMDTFLTDAFVRGDEMSLREIVQLLVQSGISVDVQHSVKVLTALSATCFHNRHAFVELLLSMGANPDLIPPFVKTRLPSVTTRRIDNFRRVSPEIEFDLTLTVQAIKLALEKTHTSNCEFITQLNALIGRCRGFLRGLFKEEQKTCFIQRLGTGSCHPVLSGKKLCFLQESKEPVMQFGWVCDNKISNIMSVFHPSNNNGILVLLPSYVAVEAVRLACVTNPSFASLDVKVYGVHDQVQFKHVKNLYDQSESQKFRMVMLATHLTESLLPSVAFDLVIDSGLKINTDFQASRLKWESKAEATDRAKYSGLRLPGICYRLYTKDQYKGFSENVSPGILAHGGLEELILFGTLLNLPSTQPRTEILSSTPHPARLEERLRAISRLKALELLDKNCDVTILGYHVTEMDLPVNLSKMLLFGVIMKCVDPILTIVSSLYFKNDVYRMFENAATIARTCRILGLATEIASDHLVVLKALQQWQHASKNRKSVRFCAEIGISESTFEAILAKRCTILGQLRALGLVRSRGNSDIRDLNQNSDCWPVVKAAICAGYSTHFGEFADDPLNCTLRYGERAAISPCSTVFHAALLPRPQRAKTYLIYENLKVSAGESQVRICTAVSPVTLIFFSGPALPPPGQVQPIDEGLRGCAGKPQSCFSDRSWVTLSMPTEHLSPLLQLRNSFYAFVYKRAKTAHMRECETDYYGLGKIVEILRAEDESLGLIQPNGIGQRPYPSSSDAMTPQRNIMPRVNPTNFVTEIRGYYAYHAPERDLMNKMGKMFHFPIHSQSAR